MACDSDYIRTYRVRKDLKWTYEGKYGTLDITVNLSKPEKDPKEIAKLRIPVLILQGDKDIQGGVDEAERLFAARMFSSYYVIEGMNHVLKHCESSEIGQLDTYRNPALPIKQELIEHIARFLLNR